MSEVSTPRRCRVVLIAPPPGVGDVARIEAALTGGDVASLIIPDYGADESLFQAHAEALTRAAQQRGVAAIVASQPRTAARVQADGIHTEGRKDELAEIVAKYGDRMMVGCGGAKTRDDALELGEQQPDYIFFGRFGYDTKPEPHPRNLSLGAWWSQIVQVPCIVMAGATVDSVRAVAETGAEFVAAGTAVFADGTEPAAAVAQANALLDQYAPALEDN